MIREIIETDGEEIKRLIKGSKGKIILLIHPAMRYLRDKKEADKDVYGKYLKNLSKTIKSARFPIFVFAEWGGERGD